MLPASTRRVNVNDALQGIQALQRRRTNDETNSTRHQVNDACEERPQDPEECLDCVDSERKDALENSNDRIEQAAQDLRTRVGEVSDSVRYGRHGGSSRKGRSLLFCPRSETF